MYEVSESPGVFRKFEEACRIHLHQCSSKSEFMVRLMTNDKIGRSMLLPIECDPINSDTRNLHHSAAMVL